jgi:hypothetical protein
MMAILFPKINFFFGSTEGVIGSCVGIGIGTRHACCRGLGQHIPSFPLPDLTSIFA